MSSEGEVARSVQAFCQRSIEPLWLELDRPDPPRDDRLWSEMQRLGATALPLPADAGGIALSPADRLALVTRLGASFPSLATGLLLHCAAVRRLQLARPRDERAQQALATLPESRLVLLDNPLHAQPSSYRIEAQRLVGRRRVALPACDWVVLTADDPQGPRLLMLEAATCLERFEPQGPCLGLSALRRGWLTLDDLALEDERVFDAPNLEAIRAEDDAQMAACLLGILGEVSKRAMDYAAERYQGGKMISEHDALQQICGRTLIDLRALRALVLDALTHPHPASEGAVSAFAARATRRACVDAIQALGGYGYMEDFRIERYLRDTMTLQTFWIQPAATERRVAQRVFAARQA